MKKSEVLGGHPVAYCVIPEECSAKILFHDRSREENWQAEISSEFGRVSFIDEETGTKYASLESLKKAGVRRVILTCQHILYLEEEGYQEAGL